jgi:hypothetical protein
MVIDLSTFAPLLSALAPAVLGAFAPMVTNLVEQGVKALNAKLPNPIKPALNAILGALLAGFTASPFGPVAGVVGAQIGNRVREAMKKGATPSK